MTRVTTALCAGLLACSFAGADATSAWHVVPLEKSADALVVPLPSLAQVSSYDRSGKTWQQSGEIGGTVASATGEFAMALGAGGWSLSKRIVLGRSVDRSELMIWTRQKCRILFMVWEKEAGTCGFAWGEER